MFLSGDVREAILWGDVSEAKLAFLLHCLTISPSCVVTSWIYDIKRNNCLVRGQDIIESHLNITTHAA